MKIVIAISPLTSNTLLATVKQFNIHIPEFVLKGIVHLKPLIELAALKKLRAFLQEQNVQVEIRSIELMTDAQTLAITGVVADVRSVNAGSAVHALLPVLRELFAEKPELKPVFDVLDILGDDTDKVVQGALTPLRDEQLEAIMKTLAAAYGDSLCKMLNELLAQKGIPVTLDTIELS